MLTSHIAGSLLIRGFRLAGLAAPSQKRERKAVKSIPLASALPKNCTNDAAALHIGMSRIVILHI
jgi:hypothetical protein